MGGRTDRPIEGHDSAFGWWMGLYRARHRNGRLLEPLKVRGVFAQDGGHLEDVVFKK
jgi:hypothetical protein